MHNIASIYRFYTPFLDFSLEKKNLLSVIKKIEKSIEFDWIDFEKSTILEWNYTKIILDLKWWLWKIELYYISSFDNNYYLPLFKLDIFLDVSFLLNNNSKKNTIWFLNNIFECFDWLNEKEFLIDIDNNLYYKNWLISSKKYPSYDFSDIDTIKDIFENWKWMKLLEDFIVKFKDKNFVLTTENSNFYHKIHSVLLYFIYLVFLMNQNLDNSKKILSSTENNNSYLDFALKRLSYVEDLNEEVFIRYKNRLDLFFRLF